MGFSINDKLVRVDFFVPSGKWYTTDEMEWDRYESTDEHGNVELITETFRRCLKKTFAKRYSEMIAVCLEPYHEHSHPLMVKEW